MTRRQISWLSGFLITALLLLPVTLTAQERTLQELKDEILARAQKNAYPVGGLRVEDVREVLSRLVSMDPDHWAREWSRAAEPYEQKADELARAGRTAEAQAAYYQAYKYYYFARPDVRLLDPLCSHADVSAGGFHGSGAANVSVTCSAEADRGGAS